MVGHFDYSGLPHKSIGPRSNNPQPRTRDAIGEQLVAEYFTTDEAVQLRKVPGIIGVPTALYNVIVLS